MASFRSKLRLTLAVAGLAAIFASPFLWSQAPDQETVQEQAKGEAQAPLPVAEPNSQIQLPPMPPGTEQNKMFNQNWPLAGEAYQSLLVKGPSGDIYLVLARLYMAEEKPVQAKYYCELALAMDPDNQDYQSLWNETQKAINYLDERFFMFSEKANQEEITSFGSMAAIRFHLGYQREALEILNDAFKAFGEDMRITPLAGSFQKEMQYQQEAMIEIHKKLIAGIDNKDSLEQSANYLGQMVFISLGHPAVVKLVEKLKTANPGAVNEETVQLLYEFAKTNPSSKKD